MSNDCERYAQLSPVSTGPTDGTVAGSTAGVPDLASRNVADEFGELLMPHPPEADSLPRDA